MSILDEVRSEQAECNARSQRPLAYQPFPVAALPESLGRFAREGAAAIGPACDPAFVALPALAVTASLIGNTRVLKLKRTWKEPSVLWTVLIGDSGTLKSPALSLAVDPLFAIQRRLRREHQRELAANPETKTSERRVLCSDITIEKLGGILEVSPRGLLLWRDELDGWFQSFKRYKSGGGSDRPQWLEMHGARLDL